MLARADRTAVRQPRKIRFSDAEWAVIAQRARLCGRAPARYVRETALGAEPRPIGGLVNADIVHQLGRVGTALASLAAQARTTGEANRGEAIDQALREVLDIARRLA